MLLLWERRGSLCFRLPSKLWEVFAVLRRVVHCDGSFFQILQLASAGNRARVTSMATMYSATRPLMLLDGDLPHRHMAVDYCTATGAVCSVCWVAYDANRSID